MNKVSGVFIFNFEDILAEVSLKLYRVIRMNWRHYSAFCQHKEFHTDKKFFERDTRNVMRWLIKPEYLTPSTDPEKENFHRKVNSYLRNNINKHFYENNYYSIIPPTKFAQGTVMNPAAMNSNRIKKVYITASYPRGNNTVVENITEYVAKYFNHEKIELLFFEEGSSKAQYFKENNISWDILVDDNIETVRQFAELFHIDGKEFLLPKSKYTKLPPEVELLIVGKSGIINYYERS